MQRSGKKLKIVKIFEVADFKHGMPCKTDKYNGRRFLRISDIMPHSQLTDEVVSSNKEVNILDKDTILFPRTGNVMFPFLYRPSMGHANHSSFLYAIHTKRMPVEYIYFQMCSPRFRSYIERIKNGRNITMEALKEYDFIINKDFPINLFEYTEKNIRKQKKLVAQCINTYQNALEHVYRYNPNTVIEALCEKIKCTAPSKLGKTPVYNIHGVCGYSEKPGNETETIGINKSGNIKFIIIPKGALASNEIECIKPDIDSRLMIRILKSLRLEDFRTKGAVPHLYFKNYKSALCCYTENYNLQFEKMEYVIRNIKKQLQIQEYLFLCQLEKYFPCK